MASNVNEVVTSEVRLAFVNVFKPQKAMLPGGKEKYGVTALFPNPATLTGQAKSAYEACMAALRQSAADAVKEKWGDKIPKPLRSPFRDQGDKQYEGFTPGAVFLTCTSEQQPGIVNAKVQDIINPTELYSGCYGKLAIRAFAYGGSGTTFAPGVAFGLQHVQKTRDGEPLSGRTKPQEAFQPIEDLEAASGADGAGGLFN